MPRLAALLVLTLLLAAPASGAEVMDRVAAAYSGIRSLTASFNQEVWQPRLGRVKRSSGTVRYLKPRKVRWEYREGQEGLLVGDGTTWFWYEEAERQVVVSPYRADAVWEELLFDPAKAGVSMNLAESRSDGGEWEVRLTPRQPETLTRSVTLVIDDRTAAVIGATVEDASGGSTSIRLSDVALNAAVREADFVFTPPPGTRVVEGR